MLTPWRRKSALGYSSGFFSSDMKEKKATWPRWCVSIESFSPSLLHVLYLYVPAYANMIFVTASNAS